MVKSTILESDPKLEQPIILIADPCILAIPIKENHDPLVDISHQKSPELLYGPSPEIPNNTDYTKIRKTVLEKIKLAQTMLPKGIRFCLYECYRSLALQEQLFTERYQKVIKKHPNFSHEERFIETTKLVSPVVNLDGTRNIPPHSTGGAIDIYLIDENGEPLEMGIHPKDWMSDIDGEISLTASNKISNTAKNNRQLMSEVLSHVGFINYPTEFWHWSYGDRYWAYHTKQSYALYGTVVNG